MIGDQIGKEVSWLCEQMERQSRCLADMVAKDATAEDVLRQMAVIQRAIRRAALAVVEAADDPVATYQYVSMGYLSELSPLTPPSIGIIEIPIGSALQEAERLVVRKTLEACQGNRSQAAKMLGLSRRRLRECFKDSDNEEMSRLG